MQHLPSYVASDARTAEDDVLKNWHKFGILINKKKYKLIVGLCWINPTFRLRLFLRTEQSSSSDWALCLDNIWTRAPLL